MIPIDYIDGLETAKLTELLLIPGEMKKKRRNKKKDIFQAEQNLMVETEKITWTNKFNCRCRIDKSHKHQFGMVVEQ